MDIRGKVFIVTGGASGLGEGTARMLAAEGGKVVVADMQADKGEQVAREIGGAFVKCDVSQEADGAGRGRQGRVAGQADGPGQLRRHRAGGKDRRQERRPQRWRVHQDDHGQPGRQLQHDPPGRRCDGEERARGHRRARLLISTASVAAYDGQIGQAAYSASKGGVVGMTLPIARDLARNGIRNMTIAPGIFGTPMLFGMPQEVQDALAASVPFPSRLGTPEDYAKLAQHIFENDMLNGEVIRLDGAIRLAPR